MNFFISSTTLTGDSDELNSASEFEDKLNLKI